MKNTSIFSVYRKSFPKWTFAFSDEISCPNSSESCPTGTSCVERHEDTIIEFQRSSQTGSSSDDFLVIDFYQNSVKVKSSEVNILNTPDSSLQTQSIGLIPQWDALEISISGGDGANVVNLRIKENAKVVFDLMARTGCDSVWLDGNFGENNGCHFGSASFDREAQFGNSGNFQLDFCSGDNYSLKKIDKLSISVRREKWSNSYCV